MKTVAVWIVGIVSAFGAGMIVYLGLSVCTFIPLVAAVLAAVIVFRSVLEDYR